MVVWKDGKPFHFKSVPPDSLLFQSTLKSPPSSKEKTELHAPSLSLFYCLPLLSTHTLALLSRHQYCLYLLYRSVRRAVRENTRARARRQSILKERKSTSVCACFFDSSHTVLDKQWSFILNLSSMSHMFDSEHVCVISFLSSLNCLRFCAFSKIGNVF